MGFQPILLIAQGHAKTVTRIPHSKSYPLLIRSPILPKNCPDPKDCFPPITQKKISAFMAL